MERRPAEQLFRQYLRCSYVVRDEETHADDATRDICSNEPHTYALHASYKLTRSLARVEIAQHVMLKNLHTYSMDTLVTLSLIHI